MTAFDVNVLERFGHGKEGESVKDTCSHLLI